MSWLNARYPGRCRCGAFFEKGQTIFYEALYKQVTKCPRCTPACVDPVERDRGRTTANTVAAIALAVLALATAPARADDNPLRCWPRDTPVCNVTENHGGVVEDFLEAARDVVRHGRHIRIAGECDSSCVIAADIARDVTCVTPNAVLRIHRVRVYKRKSVQYAGGNPMSVIVGIESEVDPPFSPDIQAWVSAHGGYRPAALHGLDFLEMPYSDAARIWRTCDQ